MDEPQTSTDPSTDPARLHDDAEARLALDPQDRQAMRDLAHACRMLGGNSRALSLLERLDDGSSGDPALLHDIANIQSKMGLFDACIDTCTRLIGHGPREMEIAVRRLRTWTKVRLGRLDEAQGDVSEYMRAGGGGSSAISLLAEIDSARGDRARARDRLRPVALNEGLPDAARVPAAFELARLHDRLGAHDEAFAMATLAGRLRNAPFDPEAFEQETEALVKVFDHARVPDLPQGTRGDERPVFVVGMPRSGTTLLDQIIDAHPEAIGLQERADIQMLARLLSHRTGRPQENAIEAADAGMLDDLADRYLDMLDDFTARRPTNDVAAPPRRLVNKALALDEHVGLVSRMLPGSRVIVIRRDPRDNLLSIFLNPILPEQHPWSTSLEGLVAARRRFDRLTAHWKDTLDLPILDVDYESLVSDPEAQIRRIIDFLDLPFHQNCLQSHRSGRAVTTPSWEQVARPINRDAVERWRAYEHHLGPVLEAFPPGS